MTKSPKFLHEKSDSISKNGPINGSNADDRTSQSQSDYQEIGCSSEPLAAAEEESPVVMAASSSSSSSTNDDENHLPLTLDDTNLQTEISSSSSRLRQCLDQAVYHLRHNWKILLLGQCLSLLLASAGATQATLHLDCGLSAPTFTMTLIYGGLSLNVFVLMGRHWRSKQRMDDDGDGRIRRQQATRLTNDLTLDFSVADDMEDHAEGSLPEGYKSASLPAAVMTHRSSLVFGGMFPQLHSSLWWYFLIAFLDVQANAITVLAFRYTTLTSVTLFDALAIPSSMIISKCWLQRKYRCSHLLGVMVCMAGVVANVLTDYQSDVEGDESPAEQKEYPHKLRGDLAAIVGGLLYGLNDVFTEVTVSATGDTTEYLAMMGLFAFLISLVQSLLLEWDDILEFFGADGTHSSTCSLQKGWWLFFTFVGVNILSYAGASRFLVYSEAAFFNLSLLTGDLWSVIFSIVAERIVPRPLFFAALAFVLSGVVIYEMAPSPASDKSTNATVNDGDVNDGIMLRQSSESCLINGDEDDQEGIELH